MNKLNNEHCCNNMDYYVDLEFKSEHELVAYEPEMRSYNFILHGANFGMYQGMNYCPWCGKKLPKSLSKEWANIVKDELHLDSILDIEWSNIPNKFKTDEWWKKLGL